ncbi:MAG TPA: hypothetical protein VGU43_00605 [Thermoplasmata archaeon]|nr:hypothetical protein [Thermoplasmata archaeon]
MADSEPSAGREVIDGLLERVLATPEMEGVYLSPWWPLESTGAAGEFAGWKRSILRREPGRGAEHWGHLFLLTAPGARPPTGSAAAPLFEISLPRSPDWPAPPATMWLRARLPEPCRRFVERLRAEIARRDSETA